MIRTAGTLQFNEDFLALRILARRIYSHIAKNHDGVAIPDEDDTILPPIRRAPGEARWPHDDAADLIITWRHERQMS